MISMDRRGRNSRHRLIILVIAVVLQYGCMHQIKPANTPPETKVAYRANVDPSAPRYAEAEGESTSIPQPVDNPPPIYPDAMIPLHLAVVTVKAKVIVNTEGAVDEVRIAPAEDPVSRPAEFDAAVRDAVTKWHYMPLTFTRWEEVKDAQGNVVDSRAASIEKKPFSLDYEFSFELRDGKPAVDGRSLAK